MLGNMYFAVFGGGTEYLYSVPVAQRQGFQPQTKTLASDTLWASRAVRRPVLERHQLQVVFYGEQLPCQPHHQRAQVLTHVIETHSCPHYLSNSPSKES